MRKLIVNADDFGQSPGINWGIIKTFEEGIVTSASLMVRYPAAKEAAAYARKKPALGVGLHVDLGEWTYRNGEWIALYEVVSADDEKAVEKEVARQLDAFFETMGRTPTHIDSHQHVHQLQNLKPVFVGMAKRLNVPLRGCSENVTYCGDFYGQCFDGSSYHEAISVEGIKKIFSNLRHGITEMACHPGLDMDVQTMYSAERETEVNSLCHPRVKETAAAENVVFCSFEGLSF